MGLILKVVDEGHISGGCIYVADVGPKHCIYALQLGLVHDVDSTSMPRAANVL